MNPDATSGLARMVARITQARLLHVRGKNDEALRLLEELHEEAETAGRMGSAIEILALKALSLQAKGKKERAVSTLAQVLVLAEPEGYVRIFADEGPPMAELLSEVLALIAAGRSNPRIAKELFVAVGTVKTHVKSVYRKLDAHSRTQAVSKARELNLI